MLLVNLSGGIMKNHVIDCQSALGCWAKRRKGDVVGTVIPYQNILPVIARLDALFRCLYYMEKFLKVDFQKYNILDVGCASGYGLTPFLLTGFSSEQLCGIDLFEDRINMGRKKYPGFDLLLGDAVKMPYPDNHFDMVMEQFCFCHIESDEVREKIARQMLRVVKPDGYILVHDWIVGSPKRHYNGVSRKKIEHLFDWAEIIKVFPSQLAPPIGRVLSKYMPSTYMMVRALLPFLTLSKITLLKKR
jgi:ubiquinone/menaquinone biosynthesis C-methylase UbiE